MTAIPATLRLRREGALRSRAARGDAVAFAAVYERHHQALYRYCRSILRHEQDAQDALQNTFTRAFAALQDERRDFELRPWLFRIAHNEAISILRRRPATDELADVVDARAFEDHIAKREELRLLQLDLADLPERQRAALVLRELNGLSHAEIGVVLELSPPAVKQAIFEARSALFSCREGREMECHDVRRMLSDGDGRILRGRGIRAHLRSCPGCSRFRADLEQRPRALKALVPPLPVGTAAALLAELLGAGTAAKLLACVAMVGGGGATLAVELRGARSPAPPAVEAVRTKTGPERRPPRHPVPVPAVATSEPQPVVAVNTRSGRPSPPETARRERPARERRKRPAPTSTAGPKPAPRATPEPAPQRNGPQQSQSRQNAPKPAKPQKAKPQKTMPKKAQKDKPKQTSARVTPAPTTSGSSQNSTRSEHASARAENPGRGPEVRAEKVDTVPPGHIKQAETVPPGQSKKTDAGG